MPLSVIYTHSAAKLQHELTCLRKDYFDPSVRHDIALFPAGNRGRRLLAIIPFHSIEASGLVGVIPGVLKHESVEQPAVVKKNTCKAVWGVYLDASGGPMADLYRSAEMVAALGYPDMEPNVEIMVEPLRHLPDLHFCQQRFRSWRTDHYFVVAKSANLAEFAGSRVPGSSESFCIVYEEFRLGKRAIVASSPLQ